MKLVLLCSQAMQQGGAVYLFDKGMITFGNICNVSYNSNTALAKEELYPLHCSPLLHSIKILSIDLK